MKTRFPLHLLTSLYIIPKSNPPSYSRRLPHFRHRSPIKLQDVQTTASSSFRWDEAWMLLIEMFDRNVAPDAFTLSILVDQLFKQECIVKAHCMTHA
ncbi:hypothetical protein M5689_010803 [Euphorbia peplus]|nr:hypothetical protein M5689_010803 [Euphorbia peplus]